MLCLHPTSQLSLYKNNSECPFFELKKSIAKYSRLGEIIMMGDFNARKGKLSDQIDQYVGQHVSEEEDSILIGHKLPNMNTRDVANPNKFGKLLVHLCDAKGDFTNYSYKGSSMIDYRIISKSLFFKIVYSKYITYHSFQVIVQFHLLCGPNSSNLMMILNNEEFLQKKPAKYVWVPNQAVKFRDILNGEEVVSGANKIVTQYLNQANESIGSQLNKVVSGVTEIRK